jgi:hypothetical protein
MILIGNTKPGEAAIFRFEELVVEMCMTARQKLM